MTHTVIRHFEIRGCKIICRVIKGQKLKKQKQKKQCFNVTLFWLNNTIKCNLFSNVTHGSDIIWPKKSK